jgi:hypothetical protein
VTGHEGLLEYAGRPKPGELPAYSGTDAICPKCGEGQVPVKWHSYGLSTPGWACANHDPRLRYPGGEHLCRRCETCGYGWMESCGPGSRQ